METIKTSWYPGHMARAFSLFKKEVKKAQVVIEVLDARIPRSSRNTKFTSLLVGKKKIVVLNKIDLVPRAGLRAWEKKITSEEDAFVVSSNLTRDSSAVDRIMACLNELKDALLKKKTKIGINTAFLKIVVIGIPNVGKSTLINRLVGRNRTRVGKKPGITLGPQWISFGSNFELLDMPGILEPNLDDSSAAEKLSMTYAVSDKVIDPYVIAFKLVDIIRAIHPSNEPEKKYPLFKKIASYANGHEALDDMASHFNLVIQEGKADLHRTACKLLKDYRDGLVGRFILDELEKPAGGSV